MSSSEPGTGWPNCACALLADWQAADMFSISTACAAAARTPAQQQQAPVCLMSNQHAALCLIPYL